MASINGGNHAKRLPINYITPKTRNERTQSARRKTANREDANYHHSIGVWDTSAIILVEDNQVAQWAFRTFGWFVWIMFGICLVAKHLNPLFSVFR